MAKKKKFVNQHFIKVKNTKAMMKALESMMGEICEVSAETAGELIRGMLKEKINDWYDGYTPDVYDRTGDLIDALEVTSVTKSSKYKYTVEVFLNLDKLRIDSHHHKILRSSKRDEFPQMIEEGWTMVNGVEREGSWAFKQVNGAMDSFYFAQKVKAYLQRQGYDIYFKNR